MKKTISQFDLRSILGGVTLEDKPLFTEAESYALDLPVGAKEKLDLYFDSQPKVSGKQRKDIQGFFYDLQPKTVTVKPEPVWERDDYLPDLEYCLNYQYDEFTDRELVDCTEKLVYDIEITSNYCLIAFMGVESGKHCFIELSENNTPNYRKLDFLVKNKQFISFNGIKFDLPIMTLFLAGKTTAELWRATEMLINEGVRAYELLKHFKTRWMKIDQVDLMEIAPGKGSLKLYGARLHCDTIQDLPFKPGKELNLNQIAILKRYCLNDLDVTTLLYYELYNQIVLREQMTLEYGIELRSKSDSQIAEAIIAQEYKLITGHDVVRVEPEAQTFRYDCPSFISFKTKELQDILFKMCNSDISTFYDDTIGEENGDSEIESSQDALNKAASKLKCSALKGIHATIGISTYTVALGGLHSCENSVAYSTDDDMVLLEPDVDSFYPSIIINQQLTPDRLGEPFLHLYEHKIYKPRLLAKKNGDDVKNNTFKICLNGSYGKYGSKYSNLYAPKLLIQVTFTGQLSLLMLIERLNLSGIDVISGNTDGLVIYCKKSRVEDAKNIIRRWEELTKFSMSFTEYNSLYYRDVNNFIGFKKNGSHKAKGAYGKTTISKNPVNVVCNEAVINYLSNGTSIEEYIYQCNDIIKFVAIRTVKGSGSKDGVYLGKVVRWYHSKSTVTPIVYVNSGNKVPNSDGCRPLQKLNASVIDDVDRQWYITEAYSILQDIGVKI